jgi:hypothetical protein
LQGRVPSGERCSEEWPPRFAGTMQRVAGESAVQPIPSSRPRHRSGHPARFRADRILFCACLGSGPHRRSTSHAAAGPSRQCCACLLICHTPTLPYAPAKFIRYRMRARRRPAGLCSRFFRPCATGFTAALPTRCKSRSPATARLAAGRVSLLGRNNRGDMKCDNTPCASPSDHYLSRIAGRFPHSGPPESSSFSISC